MKEIIKLGDTRIRIKFICRWCGCEFLADKADYTKSTINQYHTNIAGKEVWEERYEYRTSCPICGISIWADENNVEIQEFR